MTMKLIAMGLAACSLAASTMRGQGDALPANATPAEINAVEPAQAPPKPPAPPQSPAKDELFDGTEKFANGARDVTEVNMDGRSLGLLGGRRGGTGDLARKMDLVTVHTYSYNKPGMFRMEDVETFRRKLEDKSWNCFIHTRDKGGSTDLCSRTAPDKETNELVIITVEPKELTFVHTRGRVSLEDLQRMGGSVGGSDEDSGLSKPKGKTGAP